MFQGEEIAFNEVSNCRGFHRDVDLKTITDGFGFNYEPLKRISWKMSDK